MLIANVNWDHLAGLWVSPYEVHYVKQKIILKKNFFTGCQCPCGTKVSPAFYLIPSKVDKSNFVQNVQITV